jgi:GAF domain-containing protein/CheY-like chemotaxis protein
VNRHTAGRPFGPADLVQLRDFAVQASIALENVRLLRLAASRADRVKAAAEVGRLLASTLDADRILDLIAGKCRELLGADGFCLFRLEADGHLRHARGLGLHQEFMATHAPALGEGAVGKAARERRAIETTDILNDSSITLSPEARARIAEEGTRAIVAVPLVVRDEVLGALAVYHPPGYRAPAEEVEFLETLASHAAAALDNARLFAQTRRRQEMAETLAAMTQTLTGSLELATVLSLVADGVRRLLGCDGGAVGLVDPDGTIRMTAGVGCGASTFSRVVVRPGQGIGGQVLARGEPFWTSDYCNDPRVSRDFAEQARVAGLVAGLAVPVKLGDQVVGVLWALYSRPRQTSPEDIALGTDLARVVAVAVQNARLYEAARRREAEARALFEVGRLINTATLDPDRVLDLIVDRARDLMRVRACGIFRVDGPESLRYVRGAGLSAAFVEALSIPLGQGTSGRAIRERSAVWSVDILNDPGVSLDPATRALVEHEGYRAVLSVPIEIKDASYGCLAAYWWDAHEPTGTEIATLSSLATLAAVALENARLYHETRTHAVRLESLNRVGRAVSASLRLDEVLEQVAQAAAALFGATLATVWVADEESRVLTRRASHGDRSILATLPVRLGYGQGGAGRVAAERRALVDVRVDREPNLLVRERSMDVGITSFTGVPVLLGDRLLGVLGIGRRDETPLSAADQALLEALMGQAAIAIENARLYEAAQQHEAEAVALAEASLRFGATLRREAVVESLAEGTYRVLGHAWSVLSVAPDTREITAARRSGEPADPVDDRSANAAARLEVGRRLAPDLIATGGALLFPRVGDIPADHPARAAVERSGMRSLLLVPVVTSGVVRSILVGSIHDEGPQFTERDQRLAEAIADRAGTALEHARLYEELERAYEDLKTAQQHLVQTEKLRALGEMASGVAHDFNNSLAVILGRVQLVLRRIDDSTLRRWLEIVERAALDASQTVRRIQEFTRIRRDLPTETVDLNRVVRDAIEMTAPRWREDTQSRGLEVRLVARLGPIPPVAGHPAELREALMNLILNAVDAMPDGGAITVSTEAIETGVEIRVADTGIGMSEEVRKRIFEPFFSTKGMQGTGLGLAMVYGIVSRHGGQILVQSVEGIGSTFQILLPHGRGDIRGRGSLAMAPADHAARVLVIDDEEDVREALADMLREHRHAVTLAADGAEGLERLRDEAFDVVLTDLAMPGISGWQVAQAVKAARPDLPVVLVTGWGVELPAEQLRAHGVDRVMTKPFRLRDVLEVVASLRRLPATEG